MTERRLEYMPVDEIPEADRNAKAHNRDLIADSIRTFGFTAPAVIDERTGRLIIGHGRLEGVRWLRDEGESAPDGITADGATWYAPVVRGWESTDDDHAKAVVIADNRTTEAGGWDNHMLAELLDEVADYSPDLLAATGFSQEDLDQLLADIDKEREQAEPRDDEDEAPEEPAEPHSKTGDLWLLDDGRGETTHRLLCGDSTKAEDVTLLMAGERSPLMATDPPYLVDYQGDNHPQSWTNKPDTKGKHWDDYTDPAQATDFFYNYLRTALDHALTKDPAIYQWHASSRTDLVMAAWKRAKLLCHQQIVWVKARAILSRAHFMYRHEPCLYGWVEGKQPGKSRRPPSDAKTVWEIDQRGNADGIHPTQKPVETVRRALEWHTRTGEVIYEPFGGSGTAVIAAQSTGRRCYAMEESPGFCDVICRRFYDQTGQIPVHAETGDPFPVESVGPPAEAAKAADPAT